MALHLYEFLYRGRPVTSDQPGAYHVILADDVVDAFGKPALHISDAMTPEQAAAVGFGLPQIVAEINASLMADATRLTQANAALQADKTALQTALADATAQRDALQAENDALKAKAALAEKLAEKLAA